MTLVALRGKHATSDLQPLPPQRPERDRPQNPLEDRSNIARPRGRCPAIGLRRIRRQSVYLPLRPGDVRPPLLRAHPGPIMHEY